MVIALALALCQTASACSPGTYGTGTSCTACAAGTYSTTTDATSCTACASGTMSLSGVRVFFLNPDDARLPVFPVISCRILRVCQILPCEFEAKWYQLHLQQPLYRGWARLITHLPNHASSGSVMPPLRL